MTPFSKFTLRLWAIVNRRTILIRGREQKPDEGQYQKRSTPLDRIDREEKPVYKKG
jgi:hypothetical protein